MSLIREMIDVLEGPALWAVVMTALASASLAYVILAIVFASRGDENRDVFEKGRRDALRAASATYRWFEPLVDELARVNNRMQESVTAQLHARFRILRGYPPWTPAEFLATRQLEGIALGAIAFPIVWKLFGPVFAGLVAAGAIPLWQFLSVGQVNDQAQKRSQAIKLRFPFALDLLSMMMAAGMNLEPSLKNVVECTGNHPLGDELAELLRQIDLGAAHRDAFRQLVATFEDDDIRDFGSSVVQGLDLGTPLKTIFRVQSDQMRIKRSQWIEKAAAQAEVQITYPGLLIALVCMLVLLAPFAMMAKDYF